MLALRSREGMATGENQRQLSNQQWQSLTKKPPNETIRIKKK